MKRCKFSIRGLLMNLIELIVKDEATKLAELDTTLADRRKRRNRRKSAGREI